MSNNQKRVVGQRVTLRLRFAYVEPAPGRKDCWGRKGW